MSRQVQALLRGVLIFVLGAGAAGSAFASFSASPSKVTYHNTAVGLIGTGTSLVTLTNNGTATASVLSVSISLPEFILKDGLADQQILAGGSVQFAFDFAPDKAQTFTATVTFVTSDGSNPTVTLVGTGITTTAVATLSATAVSFGSLQLSRSSTRSVTVTNTGTAAVTVESLTTYPPFSVKGLTSPTVLNPNQTLTMNLTYAAAKVGTQRGSLVIAYDVLPSNGVDLSGSGTAPKSLTITNYPTLPSATQGATYLATLLPASGTRPYTFSVSSGSLVPNLTLSSSGTISGTVASTVAVGNYTFTAQVMDALGHTGSVPFTLPVGAPTGAACNNIDFDVTGTQTPILSLNDLGTGTYMGEEGGLYLNGSNTDTASHHSSGVSLAKAIQPLDANGSPDPTNGVEILLSLGVSNTEQPFETFVGFANADPQKNPKLVVINGAQGGMTASALKNLSSVYWNQVLNYLIPQAGTANGVPYSANQVVAIYVDTVDSTPQSFPTDAQTLQSDLETVAQDLHTLFPNAVIAYFNTLNYTGYSNGIDRTAPEPYGFESGFAAKWAISDQVNGLPGLNWDPNVGPVMAPWMAWGPYYWANGLLARRDGTTWSCQDLNSDGLHPANPIGHTKIATYLLNFFKTDPTATPWFLAH
jgi:Putative Ig domain/HYDIN/CFA65/VesB-like, Ig-like domain